MKSFQFFLPLLFCLCFASVHVEVVSSIGTSDGAEEWGYAEEHTCSGGSTGVLEEWTMARLHGQLSCGCRVDL
ncbi:hypothetical protein ZIOFF_012024 [Zingiber officinale]|uniref:Uncharacterized protein n=1 Tax=Zingiber officinale TaxID=94328 RepID=A0A8J5I925_ZINOF|nr:hypothetical protein ZIOFF_012024 [Zingiber officinale]